MRATLALMLSLFFLTSSFSKDVPTPGRLLGITVFSVWSPNPRKSFEWYRDKLGLQVHDDSEVQPGEPWLTLNVPGHPELLMAFKKGEPRAGETAVGSRTVFNTVLNLETDDLKSLSERLRSNGIVFRMPPQELPYGLMAVIEDPDGQVIAITERKTRY